MAFTLSTPRLRLREFTQADAPFILRQLNDPDFIAHIADRGVRGLAQAVDYLETGPMASYARHGFGLCAVVRTADGALLGMCGLIQRAYLPGPDLGYALLPEFTGQGYALEACHCMLRHAQADLGLPRVSAIVKPGNTRSRQLLDKLRFRETGLMCIPGDDAPLQLYQLDLMETPAC